MYSKTVTYVNKSGRITQHR